MAGYEQQEFQNLRRLRICHVRLLHPGAMESDALIQAYARACAADSGCERRPVPSRSAKPKLTRMEVAVFVFEAVALLVLIGYLYRKYLERFCHRASQDPVDWDHQGIEVSRLKPRIERLRGDYLADPLINPRLNRFRRSCLVLTRCRVGRLSYFRKKQQRGSGPNEIGAPDNRDCSP